MLIVQSRPMLDAARGESSARSGLVGSMVALAVNALLVSYGCSDCNCNCLGEPAGAAGAAGSSGDAVDPDALAAGVWITAKSTGVAGEACITGSATTTFAIGNPTPPDSAGESFGMPTPNGTDQVEVACTISGSTAFTVHVAAPNVTVDLRGSFPGGGTGTGSIAAAFPSAALSVTGTDCELTPIALEADGIWTKFDCPRATNTQYEGTACHLVGVLYVTHCAIE
jgi:hypothetical protein